MRNTPNPVIMPGNMIPQYEFVHDISIDMTYHGMTSISVGTISVLRMRMKM